MTRLSQISLCIFIYCRLQIAQSTTDNESTRDGRGHKFKQPNIVVIMADDMGFNDASIHGSNQLATPNIDSIGVMGITLNRMYVAPMCTPSRSAFMTGKYESNVGMQHFVIPSDQPWGLDPNEKTIAEYMKDGGYRTYLIGKWHMGFFRKSYTPLCRGFDSHFGYLGPYIDYYNHSLTRIGVPYELASGYDMRKNFSVHWDTQNQYATDLFTDKAVETIANHDKRKPMFMLLSHLAPHSGNEYDPLQAPQEEIDKFDYVQDKDRRTYAAMVSKLDQGVGKVFKALDDKDMLDNTIVLFFSDNGSPIIGQHANSGSNYPFKGQKDGPWEGSIRSIAAIWSPLLKRRQRVSNQLIHVSDWLPTFAKLAGVNIKGPIDGKNVWTALSQDLPSPRKDVLCHHDDVVPYKAYISDNFKYISGSTYEGLYDRWLSTNNDTEVNIELQLSYGEAILASDVGRILAKYTLSVPKQQTNEDASPTISVAEINEIRQKAKVTCNGHVPAPENSPQACNPVKSPCLFNIVNDPCETTNLASQLPLRLAIMQETVDFYGRIAKPPRNKPNDRRCDPAQFNGTWTWWYDELNITTTGSADRLQKTIYVNKRQIATKWQTGVV